MAMQHSLLSLAFLFRKLQASLEAFGLVISLRCE